MSKSKTACDKCTEFNQRFRCNAPDECDCPKCQGLCSCTAQPWDEIETFEDEGTYRLVFHGNPDNYYSEIYSKESKTYEQSGLEVCRRFDWINNPPNGKP